MKFYWDRGIAAHLCVSRAVCMTHLLSREVEMEIVWPRRSKIFIIHKELAVSPSQGNRTQVSEVAEKEFTRAVF